MPTSLLPRLPHSLADTASMPLLDTQSLWNVLFSAGCPSGDMKTRAAGRGGRESTGQVRSGQDRLWRAYQKQLGDWPARQSSLGAELDVVFSIMPSVCLEPDLVCDGLFYCFVL